MNWFKEKQIKNPYFYSYILINLLIVLMIGRVSDSLRIFLLHIIETYSLAFFIAFAIFALFDPFINSEEAAKSDSGAPFVFLFLGIAFGIVVSSL